MEQSGCSRCEKEKRTRPENGPARPESSGRPELFGRRISYALRGIAILMGMASH